MPNWVCNHLTIHGENAVEVMRSLLTKNEESECGYDLDFNKLIPMPEELKIISGSITTDCAVLYLRSLLEKEKNFNKFDKYTRIFMHAFNKDKLDFTDYDCAKAMKIALSYKDFDSKEVMFKNEKEVLAYGKRALDNFVKYGAKDWYDWCCENWGTKWNACHTQINDFENAEIYFDTAWSAVPYIIAKIAELHPECKIEYEYAEEDVGANAGYINFEGGVITSDEHYEDFSKEAYEMYFSLWGWDENFKFNSQKGTYEYDGGEAM